MKSVIEKVNMRHAETVDVAAGPSLYRYVYVSVCEIKG